MIEDFSFRVGTKKIMKIKERWDVYVKFDEMLSHYGLNIWGFKIVILMLVVIISHFDVMNRLSNLE